MRTIRIIFCALVAFANNALAADDVVARAMHDELTRSLTQLRLDATTRPYFIAYQVEQTEALDVQASLGAIGSSGERGFRVARVDVRVGDAKLDSSRVMRYPNSNTELQVLGWYGVELPLEDDYDALRRRFWLATDQAYKRSVEDLAVKRGILAAHNEQDRQPDQTSTPVVHVQDSIAAGKFDRARTQQLARDLSKVFVDFPQLEQSEVWLSLRLHTVHFQSSEGTSSTREIPELIFGAVARARADDGLPVWDYELDSARDLEGLPDAAELGKRLRNLAERVLVQRKAMRLGDDYTGPVLFSGSAAGNLFAGHFAEHLWPQARYYSSEVNTQGVANGMNAGRGAFERRLGSRVLPPGVRVDDDPLRERFADQALLSFYRVDDEGVAAASKTLIDDGRLRHVLCTRAPAGKNCVAGNNRGGSTLGSTLALSSVQTKSASALQGDLGRLAHEAELPYALEIEKLISLEALQRLRTGSNMDWLGDGGQGERVLLATLHYPDGHSVPVRNVRLGDVDLHDFRTIAGIGDNQALYSRPGGYNNFAAYTSGFPMEERRVSFIVPSLLFEELTAGDDRSTTVKPPLLKSPAAP